MLFQLDNWENVALIVFVLFVKEYRFRFAFTGMVIYKPRKNAN